MTEAAPSPAPAFRPMHERFRGYLPVVVDVETGGFDWNRHALLEIAQTNDLMLNPKDIGEPALWQPSRERHLASLELRLAAARTMVARACLDSLVSLS